MHTCMHRRMVDPQQTWGTPKKQHSVLGNCLSQSQHWESVIPWHEVTPPQLLNIVWRTWQIMISFSSVLSASAVTHSLAFYSPAQIVTPSKCLPRFLLIFQQRLQITECPSWLKGLFLFLKQTISSAKNGLVTQNCFPSYQCTINFSFLEKFKCNALKNILSSLMWI